METHFDFDLELQFKPIHLFLFFFSSIANKLGDHLGKRGFRVGEANISLYGTPDINLRFKQFFGIKTSLYNRTRYH